MKKMTNEYKPEEIEFLMERVKRTDYKNIVEEMNKKFDIKTFEIDLTFDICILKFIPYGFQKYHN